MRAGFEHDVTVAYGYLVALRTRTILQLCSAMHRDMMFLVRGRARALRGRHIAFALFDGLERDALVLRLLLRLLVLHPSVPDGAKEDDPNGTCAAAVRTKLAELQ